MQVRRFKRSAVNKVAHLKSLSACSRAGQAGFSLIELLAGLMIMALLAGALMTVFSGDASKATRLYADMTAVRNALNRAKMDMGGVPSRLSVLWNRADAETSTNFFNNVPGVGTWSGPYLERQPTDSSNLITINSVVDGGTISVGREAASATNGGNFSWVYFVSAANIPNPIIAEFMKRCTGRDNASPTFATSSCRATPGTGGTEVGTVEMRVTDSR